MGRPRKTVFSYPKRPRGAPPGNQNRRVHGFYAADTVGRRAQIRAECDRMNAFSALFREVARQTAEQRFGGGSGTLDMTRPVRLFKTYLKRGDFRKKGKSDGSNSPETAES